MSDNLSLDTPSAWNRLKIVYLKEVIKGLGIGRLAGNKPDLIARILDFLQHNPSCMPEAKMLYKIQFLNMHREPKANSLTAVNPAINTMAPAISFSDEAFKRMHSLVVPSISVPKQTLPCIDLVHFKIAPFYELKEKILAPVLVDCKSHRDGRADFSFSLTVDQVNHISGSLKEPTPGQPQYRVLFLCGSVEKRAQGPISIEYPISRSGSVAVLFVNDEQVPLSVSLHVYLKIKLMFCRNTLE